MMEQITKKVSEKYFHLFGHVIRRISCAFFDKNGQIQLPSGRTFHHFVKCKLGEEGVNEIMILSGEKILKLSSEKEAKIGSTPLEASRTEIQNKVGDKNSFGRYF